MSPDLFKARLLALVLTLVHIGVDTEGGTWSVAETCVAVVSACLPTFRPLFSKAARKDKVPVPQAEPYTPQRRKWDSFAIKLSTLKRPDAGDKAGKSEINSDIGSFTRLPEANALESP